jgi:hypothetical protein
MGENGKYLIDRKFNWDIESSKLQNLYTNILK